ncbi:MAG: AzlC family ABC transporter permease [Burkholderiaceae bacterium]|nr:AzlC family ABC transporter permease [Burkholderiaceae bacterium]
MFFQRANYTHPAFIQGAKSTRNVLPGLAAWGLMTGVAMVNSGMSVFEACAMTLLVYAGSSQLAAMPLISAGAPLWVILATGMCVNLRFVVFSAHLRPYVMHLPLLKRLITGYLTTDMSYVFFVSHYPKPGSNAQQLDEQQAFLAGSCGATWGAWMLASFIGVAMAHQIPLQWGLGFAGILALLGILCSLASSRLRVLSATMASVAAVAAYALPLKLNILTAIVCAVVLCLLVEQLTLRHLATDRADSL